MHEHLLDCFVEKPREGIEPPVCVNETQNATLAKNEPCTVPTTEFSHGTGGKHFNFLVILGKESRLWLKVVLYALGQVTEVQRKAGT